MAAFIELTDLVNCQHNLIIVNNFVFPIRNLFGVSHYEYYVGLKMKKAKLLLLDSSHSISEIAYALGYSMQSSFTDEFKIAMGITPLVFRKKQRHKLFIG